MYTLSVERMISTAHQLNNYDGPCARIHGHNWKIQVKVQSEFLNEIGISMDFSDLDKYLWQIVGPFDHQLLNTVPPFDKLNPTAENLVKYIYNQVKTVLPPKINVKRVKIWETDQSAVSYEE